MPGIGSAGSDGQGDGGGEKGASCQHREIHRPVAWGVVVVHGLALGLGWVAGCREPGRNRGPVVITGIVDLRLPVLARQAADGGVRVERLALMRSRSSSTRSRASSAPRPKRA